MEQTARLLATLLREQRETPQPFDAAILVEAVEILAEYIHESVMMADILKTYHNGAPILWDAGDVDARQFRAERVWSLLCGGRVGRLLCRERLLQYIQQLRRVLEPIIFRIDGMHAGDLVEAFGSQKDVETIVALCQLIRAAAGLKAASPEESAEQVAAEAMKIAARSGVSRSDYLTIVFDEAKRYALSFSNYERAIVETGEFPLSRYYEMVLHYEADTPPDAGSNEPAPNRRDYSIPRSVADWLVILRHLGVSMSEDQFRSRREEGVYRCLRMTPKGPLMIHRDTLPAGYSDDLRAKDLR